MHRPIVTSGRVVVLGLLSSIPAASCGGGSPSTVVVADSAGIAVVTNTAGSLDARDVWTISSSPIFEVGGGVEPEVPLYRVSDLLPLDGGRVAVATTVPPRVLVFDATGSLAATLGREGEGPGEFVIVGSIVALGPDSIAVWDPDRRRLSVFTESGALVREVDLSGVAPPSARAAPNTRAVSGFTHVLPSLPGSLILFGEAVLGPGGEGVVTRREMPAYRIGTDGEVLASLGPFPGMQTSPGMPAPFGARTHAASSSSLFAVGTSEATEYEVYGTNGALARIVRWPDHDRGVGGEHLSRWTEMVEADSTMGEFIRAAPRAHRFPAYDDLLATDRGEVLVAAYPGPLGLVPLRRADPAPESLKPIRRMPARPWLVFDSEGALIATLTTPEGFEPYALRAGILWGVYMDELDVESVRAYEVSEPSGGLEAPRPRDRRGLSSSMPLPAEPAGLAGSAARMRAYPRR